MLLFILLLALPSINMDSLMNGTQSGKSIFFLYSVTIISALWIIRFWLNQELVKIKLSTIDLLLATVVLYILLRNNRAELVHSLLFLELTGLAILYFIIRQQNRQSYLWLFIALIAGGLIQSIYGNLQLWGYFPSHHGLFKMTGSFFNPGPYSGYLAAVFSASLGLYLFDAKFEKFDHLIIRTTEHWHSISMKCFCRLKKFLSFESPNNSNNRNDSNNSNPSNISNIEASNSSSGFFRLFRLFSFFCLRPLQSNHSNNRNNRNISNPSNSNASNPSNISNNNNPSNSEAPTLPLIRSLAIAAAIAIILVLPASRSRAAWLAVLVSSSYLFLIKHQLYSRIRLYFNTRIRQFGLISLLAILLTTTVFGLYHFKKGSADGRLLIWKVSAEMIKDKPLLGHGYDGFKKHYMDYQAEYFQYNSESKEALVAGDTNYAFNELIQLTVEYGLVGLLLVLLVIIRIFSNPSNSSNREASNPSNSFYRSKAPTIETIVTIETSQTLFTHISRAVILSILVFGLFSYPLQILPVKICLVVAVAIVAGKSGHIGKINSLDAIQISNPIRFGLKSILSVGCLGLLWLATEHLNQLKTAHTDWKNAFDIYNVGAYPECLEDFELAYPQQKTNGVFLTNYGKALSMAEKHDEAVGVLKQATRYYPNIVVYTALGDSYKNLGRAANAEQAYFHAWYMNPSRFYPLYLLAKLYDETEQNAKAIEVAKELLEKDIKIESTAIKEIQEEMRMIVEKNKVETFNESKI